LVERGMAGVSVGKRLKKLGLKAQDTSELFFDNVRVPADNLLGGESQENKGFICLMEQLPWKRLQIAITAVASAQAAIDWTVAYMKERKVFGQAVSSSLAVTATCGNTQLPEPMPTPACNASMAARTRS
jgi:alkylation response protein AidB-like acyl-CoA dehydrogenase